MAKIGIIMRTKNRPILLKRALDSVVQQTMGDWQLALVNDGGEVAPVDALVEALPEDQQAKIIRINHSESVGMEAASNAGLANLDSKYAIIHDDDDSLHPEFFQKTSDYLDNPPHWSIKGVVTKTNRVHEKIEGNNVTEIKTNPYNEWLQDISLRRLLVENSFAPIAFLFDREACVEVGAFREDLPVLGDWDFNIRFLCQYEIGLLPETLAYYHDRIHEASGDYASTIQAKMHLHAFFDNLLRNEWLRKDIQSGRTGTGLIANKARMLSDLSWEINNGPKKKKRFFLF
jgi:glycosyltransferase involved in cell wall biosynthesis